MMRIKLILIGAMSDTPVYNLATDLDARQSFFDFSVWPEAIPVPSVPTEIGVYDEDSLESAIGVLAAQKLSADEYPIGICDLPLRGELSTSFDERRALISVHKWSNDYPGFPLTKILAYNLVDILLTRKVSTPVHDETRACPSDFCDNRKDRLLGLKQCEFCSECRAVIASAVRHGEMSIGEGAAIQRILDWVAGRKRAFVLMPFAKDYDNMYHTCVRPAAESQGWVCQRADEIHRAQEILDLIWQGIHTADLIIADLTGRNPNVFYEVGYAQALGRPTVLLAQTLDDVPFDLRGHQVVRYDPGQVNDGTLATALQTYLRDL